jgi:hypothetical protein
MGEFIEAFATYHNRVNAGSAAGAALTLSVTVTHGKLQY